MGRRPDPKPHKMTVVRYETREGKRCKKGDPGARKVKTETDSYYATLPDPETGRGRHYPLETSDITQAWANLRDLLQTRKEEQLGLVNDRTRQLGRPIAEHLDEWLASVAAARVTPKRVGMMRSRMERLICLAGWRRISEIRKSSCQLALEALQAEPSARSGERGRSAQTRNHYLSHARQFARWLHHEQRLPDDPLAGMKGVSVEGDRRHDRRCPEDLEIRVLFDHLAGLDPTYLPPLRKGMTGPRRALGYQVSMCSGLRAGELRSLTAASFDLATGELRLKAKKAKNRKRTLQPLPRWLCDALRVWLDGGGQLWEAFPENWPGRLLRDDLALAREAWLEEADSTEERAAREASTVCLYEVETEDGPLYWDFHALRHWYVTQLAGQHGISPGTMQALARHSDPKLTLGTYSHARQDHVREAVDRIRMPGREMGPEPPE